VNQLRQLMLEELHRPQLCDTTSAHTCTVLSTSAVFPAPADQLGPEDIRKYQAMLFTKLKYSPNTRNLRLAALRSSIFTC